MLFTDMELPGGMNRTELAEMAQKLAPNIKVLLPATPARRLAVHKGTPRAPGDHRPRDLGQGAGDPRRKHGRARQRHALERPAVLGIVQLPERPVKAPIRKLRCAVYTRVSTDERLDMEFNSLDAQREARLAYIQSQKHEGWILVGDRYGAAAAR